MSRVSYEAIDSVFRAWAKRNALQVFTHYQDTDVRTVFLHGADSQRGQIWVDPPSQDGTAAIHIAVYRRRGRDNQTSVATADLETLDAMLDEAYATVVKWLSDAS